MSIDDSFDSIADRFWDRRSEYGVQTPLTDEALRVCESELGVSLPPSLVRLLRIQNGGPVNLAFAACPTTQPTSWADDHVPFEMCNGIGTNDDYTSINDSDYLNKEWGQPDRLVLLQGEGHWWIALDYRDSDAVEPAVIWFDNEVGEDIRLADTFADFVLLLTPAPDDA